MVFKKYFLHILSFFLTFEILINFHIYYGNFLWPLFTVYYITGLSVCMGMFDFI